MQLQVDTQREFAHSAEKVWKVAGDFGGLKHWLPGILACRVEGSGAADRGGNAVRLVEIFDGSVTKERLEWVDEGRFAYGYRILEAKGIDASAGYVATFTVTPLDAGRCRVDWVARFSVPDTFPAEKQERAKQKVSQMYTMCLQALEGVLARG